MDSDYSNKLCFRRMVIFLPRMFINKLLGNRRLPKTCSRLEIRHCKRFWEHHAGFSKSQLNSSFDRVAFITSLHHSKRVVICSYVCSALFFLISRLPYRVKLVILSQMKNQEKVQPRRRIVQNGNLRQEHSHQPPVVPHGMQNRLPGDC